MSDRSAKIDRFLDTAGWGDARRAMLAGDASPRRYLRLARQATATHAVLMDAPPNTGGDIGPFLSVGAFLRHCGLSAPEILAADEQAGLILMEDMGDALFARVCASSAAMEPALYAAATDVLAYLQGIAPPAGMAPYSAAVYAQEAALATDWYLPAALGAPVDTRRRDTFLGLITRACASIAPENPVCVLRDYHAENLLWLPARKALARVGLLDFQDALAGHPAYDLVSLLEDARRDTDPDLREDMIRRYLTTSGLPEQVFRRAYATLGAQRNLKIIGIFCRLFLRDGKPAYLDLIPRVWAHLQTDLRHPTLGDLQSFVRDVFPVPTADVLQQIREGADDA